MVSTGRVTDYAGNYIYENNQLQFFNHAEGYVTPNDSDYDYVYQYKDHLGNVRLSYQDADNNGSITTDEIVEESNYYPFGLKHRGYGPATSSLGNSVAQRWKYNGVELEESLDIDLYEMDFRNYDPTIARFISIDPITHHSQSTYTAFDNNPIFWADPSGADGEHYNWNTGRYEDDHGNEVSFETAMSSVGIDISEDKSSPPTKFVTEEGEVIVETDDGSDEVYVISTYKEDKFIANLANNIDLKKDKEKSENDILGYRYGYNLRDHMDYVDVGLDMENYGDYGSDFSNEREIYFQIGYNKAYSGKQKILTELSQYFENSASVGMGIGRGLAHRRAGRMHAYDPQISKKPHKYIIKEGSITINNE